MAKKLSPHQRHVRWNYEQASHDPEKTTPHLVIADDRDREGTILKILSQSSAVFGGVEQLRQTDGKIRGSKLRYLFRTYEG